LIVNVVVGCITDVVVFAVVVGLVEIVVLDIKMVINLVLMIGYYLDFDLLLYY
jgi:hypothetical protein